MLFILFSMYIIGFCFAMENVDETLLTHQPKRNNTLRYQKGRWKHHPQGLNRPWKHFKRPNKYNVPTRATSHGFQRNVDGWASKYN